MANGTKDNIEHTWDVFLKGKDSRVRDAAKEKLILHYAPMIKFIVGRMSIYATNAVDHEDLTSYGIFGLIDAIDKFDLMKGVKFETYASLRIRGAILDGLRALDWVPRALRQKSKRVDEAYAALESELMREPTNAELADRLGIDVSLVDEEIKKTSLVALISLDDYLDGNHEVVFGDERDHMEENPERIFEHEELKQELARAVSNLTEQEQMVVNLYYFEELTLKEISKILDVSESRVSQVHSKAMLKLRTRLSKYRTFMLV